MRTKALQPANRLSTTQLAARYGVSAGLLDQWRRYAGFPVDAATREGTSLWWDCGPVDDWLRSRRISQNGPAPRWLNIVNHPDASARV